MESVSERMVDRMDFTDYENECTMVRHINDELLEIFEKDMTVSGLSDKTIRRHLSNVDFYLNTFLLREDIHPMEDGLDMLGLFLGDFFIRKCMWSTPGTIKSTAASIKKFYKCMLDHGKIEKEAYASLCDEIRDEIDIWQADCEAYNDPDQMNPFAFF